MSVAGVKLGVGAGKRRATDGRRLKKISFCRVTPAKTELSPSHGNGHRVLVRNLALAGSTRPMPIFCNLL
jgi:hypothetical protein